MSKWIDEIVYDFVMDMFKKSKKETNYKKAEEVHDFIRNKTPEEFAKIINISEKDWNLAMAWREAEQCASRLLWKYYQIF